MFTAVMTSPSLHDSAIYTHRQTQQ